MICVKCKMEFQSWNPEVERKFKKGHVPMCADCFYSTYGGLPPAPKGKAGYVESRRSAADTSGAVPTKGTKLYACADCKHERFEPWIIQDRAARIRCPGCGSLKYEPKTAAARSDMTDKKDVAKAFGDADGSNGGQSFIRG